MNKIFLQFIFSLAFYTGYSQQMWVKTHNLNNFGHVKKLVTAVLDTLASEAAKKHPEYGILPFNAPCSECVELVDRRTVNTRFFVDPMVPYHSFSQTSYFPLHYRKNKADVWLTIDPRLMPDSSKPGVYIANQQPVPAKCDLNKKSASITVSNFEFEFNKNLTLYYADENVEAISNRQTGNYADYTIGEQGLQVTNMWPSIDMQQVFGIGEVKTSYIVNAPLITSTENGYLVIEDHFTLPDGYTFHEVENGAHLDHMKFKGDYELKDKENHIVLRYRRPVYTDANSVGMQGIYKLAHIDSNYTLQILIPVSWLRRTENVYPLTIDPLVSGDSAMGNFISSGLQAANLGFTSDTLGSCDYHMSVSVPGGSQILNTYLDLEYQLTYSNTCGSPPEPAPYCSYTQIRQYLSSDKCGQPMLFACPNSPGANTGICTTDSSYGLINGFLPRAIKLPYSMFLSCYAPQCADYDIPLTLKNIDSICGDVCGYLCARGTKWAVTIEACTINASITESANQICAGEKDTFTVSANCGLPPYYYVWTKDAGNTFDTIYGSDNYVIAASDNSDSVFVECYAFDSCGNFSASGVLPVSICTDIPTISDNGFKLFPNPADDIVLIKSSGLNNMASASIYDVTGREVIAKKTWASGEISFPIASLSQGLYYVYITSNSRHVVMSFVKQ